MGTVVDTHRCSVMHKIRRFSALQVDKHATASLLGWVVSAYGLGQLFSCPLLGYWSYRAQARQPIIFSLILQLCANVLYGYVQSFPEGTGGAVLTVSRSLMGVASGLGISRLAAVKLFLLLLNYRRRMRVISEGLEIHVEGGRVSRSWCNGVVGQRLWWAVWG